MKTLAGIIQERSSSDSLAFIDYDQKIQYSWKEFEKKAKSIALFLEDKFKKESPYILICTQQNILFPASLYACWKIGAVPILIHEDYTDFEFSYVKDLLLDEDPVLLIDQSFSIEIKNKFKNLSRNTFILEPGIFVSGEEKSHSIKLSDLALGLFTSGTSDRPKLIAFTHQDLAEAARIEAENESQLKNAVVANLRPHFTSGGLNTLWAGIYLDAAHLFSEKLRKRPIARFIRELLSQHDVSLFVLSPSYLQMLIDSVEKDVISDKKRLLYFGGMSLPEKSLETLEEQGFIPVMRYGMTEIGHIISKRSGKSLSGNVGKPSDNFEVKVQGDRIAVKSPGVASFQIQKGKRIELKINGWFITEDKGTLLPNHEIILEGREHSIICVNGFRFHANQVEKVLLTSKILKDCRVMGLDDSLSGQEVIAFCIPENLNDLNTNVLAELALKNLSPFKRPKQYIWLEKWPYLVNGKIDFKKLKARAENKN
jgi:acyl-coenzyme A synthetase/AMP-(fatty) acid ligase